MTTDSASSRLKQGLRKGLKGFFREPIYADLERPVDGQTVGAALEIAGWAHSTAAPVRKVEAFLDGVPAGTLPFGVERPDITSEKPWVPLASGFAGRVAWSGSPTGKARLTVYVTDELDNVKELERTLVCDEGTLVANLDGPAEGTEIADDRLAVAGWAHPSASAVSRVEVLVSGRLLGTVSHSLGRPDVAAAMPGVPVACGFSGSVPLAGSGLSAGEHGLVVRVVDQAGHVRDLPRGIRLAQGFEPSPSKTPQEPAPASPIAVPEPAPPPPVAVAVTEPAPTPTTPAPVPAAGLLGELDAPADGARVPGELLVAGWAAAPDGADVTWIEASLDGAPLGAIRHGSPRPDVAAALPQLATDELGFARKFFLPPALLGPRTLRVTVLDAKGRGFTRERRIEVGPPEGRIFVDEPAAGSVSAGTIVVGGWAFHAEHAIVAVEAFLGGRSLGRIRYGIPRPDVYALHQVPNARRCGFYGEVAVADARPGPATITVRATDERGRETEAEVEIRFVRPDEPLAELERVLYRGDLLTVEGWAFWPRTKGPCHARLFLDGRFLAESRVSLSRPDVRLRFQGNPAAARCGFSLRAEVGTKPGDGQTLHDVSIELTDADGQLLTRSAHVAWRKETGSSANAALTTALAARLADASTLLGGEASLLDWGSELDLAAALPGRCVFSPTATPGGELPYLDASIDLVLLVRDDPRSLDEARRVARVAVLKLERLATPEGPLPQLLTLWEREAATPVGPRETVSIVIPVYGKRGYTEACLAALLATLPGGVPVEVLVVDDASPDDTAPALAALAARESRIRVLTNETNLGFLDSCNRGAREARGDVLVFLNNDTLPRPGFLEPLLRSLRELPKAGAVVGKLLYPDGSLQEAGGVVFDDASGCNFGRGDESPEDPLYDHVREVDYGSGALLATRRDLFLSRGGFDVRYRPAYYEDTDYCFALRELGYKVYYQPESAVVHFEGVTSGTDLTAGAKKHQVVNRVRFQERWADALKAQPKAPSRIDRAALHRWVARDPKTRRALVVSPRLPEYDREGGSRRLFHLVEMLLLEGFHVSYLAQNATGGERYGHGLRQMGVAVYAGPGTWRAGDEYLPSPDALIANGRFDLAVLAFWNVAEQLTPLIRGLSPGTRIVVDSVDLHFLRNARSAFQAREDGERGRLDVPFADETRRELNAYAEADVVLTVSAKEAGLIDDLVGRPGHALELQDTEDVAPSTLPFDERRGLLFIGNFRHPPNIQAAEHLCTKVLPLLPKAFLEEHPVFIVGNDLNDTVREYARELSDAGLVKLVGWVPSVVPYLQKARVSLIPLLYGAGTKRKLIQALMAGTPSVSTSIGVEGLDVTSGHDVLVADGAEAFARAVHRLATDRETWEAIARSGRERVDVVHGRDAVRKRFTEVLAAILPAPVPAPPPPKPRPRASASVAQPDDASPGRAGSAEYRERLRMEVEHYADVEVVHDLPPIYHYWSNRYLRPRLESLGFSSPDGFYLSYLESAAAAHPDREIAVLSVGSGNGDTEVRLASELVKRGIPSFRFVCMDLNPEMLERGRRAAEAAGLADRFRSWNVDFNAWRVEERFDVVLANQSLHHCLELETLFSKIHESLHDDGLFLTSDMIGRNGHMRWPEALEQVESLWALLPDRFKYDHQLRRLEKTFVNRDCSVEGFEGIRAQDILPLLVERFSFDLFFAFANVIDVFVDRSFGPNFDGKRGWDRAFIDHVARLDEALIDSGRLTPTHLIAAMTKSPRGATRIFGTLSPRSCIRPTRATG